MREQVPLEDVTEAATTTRKPITFFYFEVNWWTVTIRVESLIAIVANHYHVFIKAALTDGAVVCLECRIFILEFKL